MSDRPTSSSSGDSGGGGGGGSRSAGGETRGGGGETGGSGSEARPEARTEAPRSTTSDNTPRNELSQRGQAQEPKEDRPTTNSSSGSNPARRQQPVSQSPASERSGEAATGRGDETIRPQRATDAQQATGRGEAEPARRSVEKEPAGGSTAGDDSGSKVDPKQGNKVTDQARSSDRPRTIESAEKPKLEQTDVKPFDVPQKYDDPAEQQSFEQDYKNQVARQQDAINAMSAKDYADARNAYRDRGRHPEAAREQERMRDEWKNNRADSILQDKLGENQRLPADQRRLISDLRDESVAQANNEAKELAALHEPDQVAGGANVAEPTEMGRADVNQSIGPSWKGERLATMDKAAGDAIESGQGDHLMNVRLETRRVK